jgi:hypothetical protein
MYLSKFHDQRLGTRYEYKPKIYGIYAFSFLQSHNKKDKGQFDDVYFCKYVGIFT